MKKNVCAALIAIALAITPAVVFAQAAAAPAADELDGMFEEQAPADGKDQGSAGAAGEDLLQKVLTKDPFLFNAEVRLLAGYSPGLDLPEDDLTAPFRTDIAYADKFLLDMNSSASVTVNFSPALKLFTKVSVKVPEFKAEFTELFADFNLENAVFARVGRQKITWGVSPNYPFANLTARVPNSSTVDAEMADSLACKASIPFGVGGIDLLAFTRTSLWDAPDAPSMDEIGFGTRVDFSLPNLDLTLGGYYHRDLDTRCFLSLKSTLFGTVEAYTEGVLATDLFAVADPAAARYSFSANAGFYVDFFDKALRLNAEYFFCGEQHDLTVMDAKFTLFPGHNLALNASLDIPGSILEIRFMGRYNFDRNSGLLIPAVFLRPMKHIAFTLAAPIVLGPATGGYFMQNTDSDHRRYCLVLAVIVSGKI
jgi:hypothetical protein